MCLEDNQVSGKSILIITGAQLDIFSPKQPVMKAFGTFTAVQAALMQCIMCLEYNQVAGKSILIITGVQLDIFSLK